MRHIILLFLSFALAACGANIDVHKPIPHEYIIDSEKKGYSSITIRADKADTPGGFISSLSNNLRQYLTELSLYPKKNGLLKVRIQIIGYDIKGGASREVMGSLAGADEVQSTVQVINTDTDEIVGASTVITSSSMAYGQKAMAWVHADDIATFLSVPN